MRAWWFPVLAVAAPVSAQTGAFDMGQLTGTLSQDAVTQSEERRAGIRRAPKGPAISPATRARLRATCRQMRGRGDAGAGLADYQRFNRLCMTYGY